MRGSRSRYGVGAVAILSAGCCLLAGGPGPGPLLGATGTPDWAPDLPRYDHVVIVVEENKGYDQVIGRSQDAPYINNTLRREGANLTRMFGEEHHSQGNYFWLFSGSNQGVGFMDKVPSHPLSAQNLGEELITAGGSFTGYSESLPSDGFLGAKEGLYARKHVPWASFDALVPFHVRLERFPGKDHFDLLPTVAFVIPNLENDMHNGHAPESVRVGDAWLRSTLGDYYEWAKAHNSLLVVTFDEDQHAPACGCLTDPGDPREDQQNRIPTIIAGARVRAGDYALGHGATHVNILRTLEAMYGLPRSGAQQPLALRAGIPDAPMVDLFVRGAR
jgi:acid phosphatase